MSILKFLLKASIAIGTLLVSSYSFSAQLCRSAPVTDISITDNIVTYQQPSGENSTLLVWRKLGDMNNMVIQTQYSAVLSSLATRSNIQLGYANGFNCSINELTQSVTYVSTEDLGIVVIADLVAP
jgi:hypothetical protein